MLDPSRSFALLWATAAFALLLTGSQLPVPPSISAVPRTAMPSPCGTFSSSRTIAEPPDVDVSALPLDADGERELILAVHRAGPRFCYRYRWDGAVQMKPPTLRVRRGERFALRVVNDIGSQSAGEVLSSRAIEKCMPRMMPMLGSPVAHYRGYLNHSIDDRYVSMQPTDTNFHLHGFIGPASEEDIFLSSLSTPMRACEYHITIPRSQPPGTYFYHPHVHGASQEEVAGGLSGVWIVEPDAPQLPRSAEHVILIKYRLPFAIDNAFVPDDSGITTAAEAHEAALPRATPVSYDPFDPPPWPLSYPMRAGSIAEDPTGCDGLDSEAVVAIDGSDVPASLGVPAGQTQLLRIVNATSDSPKALQLRDRVGRVVPMQVVGRDGTPVNGDAGAPFSGYIPMTAVVLPPFGRADVLVTVADGQPLTLSSEHFCSGSDEFFQMHHDLLHVTAVSPGATNVPSLNPAPVNVAQTPAAKLVAFARAHPNLVRRRAITFTEYAFPKKGRIPNHGSYFITDTTDPQFREHSFWPSYARGATVPSNADVVVKAGTIEEWYLINTTMEVHAFHIHQMPFVQERSSAGVPLTLDSALVPVGELLPNPRDPNYPLVRPRITRLLLDFRHVLRGTFVFHCHMLFHEDHGMMGIVRVE